MCVVCVCVRDHCNLLGRCSLLRFPAPTTTLPYSTQMHTHISHPTEHNGHRGYLQCRWGRSQEASPPLVIPGTFSFAFISYGPNLPPLSLPPSTPLLSQLIFSINANTSFRQ